MPIQFLLARCCYALILISGFIYTLAAAEPKGKGPVDEIEVADEKDADGGSLKIGDFKPDSMPYNPQIPGLILHGDHVVNVLDSKTGKNIGTETLHFHYNMGMKINRLAEQSPDYDSRKFTVKKTGDDTYTLTAIYKSKTHGDLVLEVNIFGARTTIFGKMIFTLPDGQTHSKYFTGEQASSLAMDKTNKVDPIAVPQLPPLNGKSIDTKTMNAFHNAYVDAIEKHHATSVPSALASWFKSHESIRKDFWLALSPQFDEAKSACAIMEDLRAHNAKAVEQFPHLAIAIAVVYDSEKAISESRMKYLWAVTPAQFAPVCSYIETFDYFANKANQSRFAFKPDQLPWPILVHLVDFDISKEEIAWAWKNCSGSRKDIGELYQTVPYDHDKLARKATKLGSNPYTLENLRKLGGVCVDQAHFTSRVAKAFGIPSMKVAGENRYGGLHAWTGFLVNDKGRPQLDFTGRYLGDYYYTGDIYDPQTNTMILDREVAMLYDGISLSFFKYQDSMTLSRAAQKLLTSEPKTAMQVAEQAINRDTYNPDAWRVLANGVATGVIDQKQGNVLVARLMKDLVNHPDLTLDCLKKFMVAIPTENIAARQKIFNKAYGLYAKRPDLQIQLRLLQCEELVRAEKQTEALQISIETCTANAKEGGLILPLISYIVTLSKECVAKNPRFQLRLIKQALNNIETDFPQNRGNEVSKAYLSLKDYIKDLE